MADQTTRSAFNQHRHPRPRNRASSAPARGALLLAATLALAPLGTAAFADTHIPAATKATGKASAVAAADATGEGTSVTTGSINQEPTYAQRMNECVQIWDRGTHMTRKQWRRSCQETLRSLKW